MNQDLLDILEKVQILSDRGVPIEKLVEKLPRVHSDYWNHVGSSDPLSSVQQLFLLAQNLLDVGRCTVNLSSLAFYMSTDFQDFGEQGKTLLVSILKKLSPEALFIALTPQYADGCLFSQEFFCRELEKKNINIITAYIGVLAQMVSEEQFRIILQNKTQEISVVALPVKIEELFAFIERNKEYSNIDRNINLLIDFVLGESSALLNKSNEELENDLKCKITTEESNGKYALDKFVLTSGNVRVEHESLFATDYNPSFSRCIVKELLSVLLPSVYKLAVTHTVDRDSDLMARFCKVCDLAGFEHPNLARLKSFFASRNSASA